MHNGNEIHSQQGPAMHQKFIDVKATGNSRTLNGNVYLDPQQQTVAGFR